jgi:hypothetical protein
MKRTRHTVTFEEIDRSTAVALADSGICDDVIAERTGLTKGQIAYALTKGARLQEFEKGKSWRWRHRHGVSYGAKMLLRQVVPQVREKIQRTLPKKIDRPTPQVVELKQAA